MTIDHSNPASVAFQEGQINTFSDALAAYVQQFRTELQCSRKLYQEAVRAGDVDAETRNVWRKDLDEQTRSVDHIARMTRVAGEIYHRVMEKAEKEAVEQISAFDPDDHVLQELADALRTGLYGKLEL